MMQRWTKFCKFVGCAEVVKSILDLNKLELFAEITYCVWYDLEVIYFIGALE